MPADKLGQPPPIVVSMVLADCIHQDRATRKYYILGTHNRLAVARMPGPQSVLHLFVMITNGHGLTVLRTRVSDVDDVYGSIHESAHTMDLSDPNRIYEIVCNIGVSFPAPGDYRIQLYAGSDLLRELRLGVEEPP